MCLDGNIPVSTINYVCSLARKHNINGKQRYGDQKIPEAVIGIIICYMNLILPPMCVTVWYEPTDAEKACKPFLSDAWKSLSYSTPNLAELCVMNKALGIQTPEGDMFFLNMYLLSHLLACLLFTCYHRQATVSPPEFLKSMSYLMRMWLILWQCCLPPWRRP